MSDVLTNAQAAALLHVAPGSVGQLRYQFRLVNDKDEKGRVQWRGDVIRKAVEIRAAALPRRASLERLIEAAVREVEG